MSSCRSFLEQVAAHYDNHPCLHNLCFVLPNRRAGQFLERAFNRRADRPRLLPRVTPMPDFVADTVHCVVVEPIEATLLLYEAYREVFGEQATEFDRFIFWAGIVLADFNDVDMSLVDPERLYANLRDLRDISTDYIVPELRQYINSVLNLQLPPAADEQRFWRHNDSGNEETGEMERQFVALWERLAPLYHAFHRKLNDRGLTTLGRAYRDAAKQLADTHPDKLPFERVVFVGFAGLSTSERLIFKLLADKQKADFWWDIASPLVQSEANPGTKLVADLAQQFPAPAPLDDVQPPASVAVHSVASGVGQAKLAFTLLDQMMKDGTVNPESAIDTAVVLPDEQMLLPVLNSVSPSLTKLNVTMGYPMRLSGIASLMRIVARAHHQCSHNQHTGRWLFFRDDVKDFLSHPLVKIAFTADTLDTTLDIERSNEFNVPSDLLTKRAFGKVFEPLARPDSKQNVLDYIRRLVGFCNDLHSRLESTASTANNNDSDPEAAQDVPLQRLFIDQYARSLRQLAYALDSHALPATDTSLFYLIERLTAGFSVPFTGEPLEGLQVMGMLETRCLDFNKVIILSMNERVYPHRRTMNSFISSDLRAAYGMPTADLQEAVETYHFYRLIGRAGVVHLIYDSSTQAMASAEPSRFIDQLKMSYGIQIKKYVAKLTLSVSPPLSVSAPKDGRIELLRDQNLSKKLSASAINEFITCPFKYYLHHIERLSDDNEPADFMDSATFGDIVHNTLQELYYPPLPNGSKRTGSFRVGQATIEDFKNNRLGTAVKRQTNLAYLRRSFSEEELSQLPSDDSRLTAPLTGEKLILSDTIAAFVRAALDYDLDLLHEEGDAIEVIECEQKHDIQLVLGEQTFNFTYKPDRVDRVGGRLRIVDYKTGHDTTSFGPDVKALFDAKNLKRPKAILQLLLYCNAWHQEHRDTPEPIQAMIYKLSKKDESGVTFKRGDKTTILYIWTPDDPEVNQPFVTQMEELLAGLFNPEVPFVQAETDKACRWCHFVDFCRRSPKSFDK